MLHSLTIPLLVGNGVPAADTPNVEKAVFEIAPAFTFQRDDDTVNWAVVREYTTDTGSVTAHGLADTDKNGDPVTWQGRVSFQRRGQYVGGGTFLFQIPTSAGASITYPSDVTPVDVVQPPEYGPTWAEQAEAAKDAAVVAQEASEAAAASVQRNQPGGVAGLTTSGKLYEAHIPDRLSDASLSATFSPLVDSFELAPATQYGDSYGNNAVGSTADLVTAFMFRVASRLRMQAMTDRSVSATRSDQIQQRAAATWTAPGRGCVFVADNILNDAFQNRSATATYPAATRSMLEYLSALSIAGPTGQGIQYGPGWTNGVSSTANSYVDFAFTGDAVVIAALAGTSGGVFRIRDTTGTVRATVTTSGWSDTFGLTTRLTGFGAGDHTVRVEVVSGTVTIAHVIVPSPTPVPIVWWLPGPLAGSVGAANNSKVDPFRPVARSVAAEFPNVIQVEPGNDWDPDTMLSTDLTHHNDKGNAYAADRIIKALLAHPFSQGLNRLVEPAAYVAPNPAFTTPSATVPAQVTGVTATASNQIKVVWNAASDGGATLTGYVVQTSPDGSTWTTAATVSPALTTYTIESGLTAGTTYQVRVIATNAKGASTPSATSSAVAGTVLTVYSADALTAPTAGTVMGNSSTGNFPWSFYSGVEYRRTTDGAFCLTAVTDRNFCVVNDGQAEGTFELTIGALGTAPGLAFCMASDFTTGYLVYSSGTQWILAKQTALASRTNLGTFNAAFAAGDKITVVKSGSSITVKLNGTTIITATDAAYSGTRHGLYAYSGNSGRFRDWRHTS